MVMVMVIQVIVIVIVIVIVMILSPRFEARIRIQMVEKDSQEIHASELNPNSAMSAWCYS